MFGPKLFVGRRDDDRGVSSVTASRTNRSAIPEVLPKKRPAAEVAAA
jgi:hypothetical protein